MNRKFGLLAAIPVVAGLLAATPANAYWNRGYGGGYGGYHGGYGYHGGGYYHGGYGYHGGGCYGCAGVAGAIVGLGVGAAIAGAYAPRYYAPPPVVYAPPPVVYAPPPAYYPGYYP